LIVKPITECHFSVKILGDRLSVRLKGPESTMKRYRRKIRLVRWLVVLDFVAVARLDRSHLLAFPGVGKSRSCRLRGQTTCGFYFVV